MYDPKLTEDMDPKAKRDAILAAAKNAGPRFVRLRGTDLVAAIEAVEPAKKTAPKKKKKGGDPVG